MKPGVKFDDLPPVLVQVKPCAVARLFIYNHKQLQKYEI